MKPTDRALRRLERCFDLRGHTPKYRGGGSSGDVWAVTVPGEAECVYKVFRHRRQEHTAHEVRMATWAQQSLSMYCVGFAGVETVGPYTVASMTVDGVDLFEVCKAYGVPYPLQSLRWVEELAVGMREMHRHGMQHNDVKPENVLIDPHGHARYVDFAYACQGDRNRGNNAAYGSSGYMHPRLRVRAAKYRYDATTDAYGLLCTVRFLCSGVESTDGFRWSQLRFVGHFVENELWKAHRYPDRDIRSDWVERLLRCCAVDRRFLLHPVQGKAGADSPLRRVRSEPSMCLPFLKDCVSGGSDGEGVVYPDFL